MEHILSKSLVKPLPIFSHATIHNGLIFTSCIQGFDHKEELAQEVEQEARQMFLNLEVLLRECGSDLKHILKMTIFFADLKNDFLPVNQVINQIFKENPPARSSIGVGELPRHCRVVVECVAVLP